MDDFLSAAASLTNVQQGVLGLDEAEPILGWYPNSVDSSLQWFSYDGEHVLALTPSRKPLRCRPSTCPTREGLTGDQKTAFTATGPWELFLNQDRCALGWRLGRSVLRSECHLQHKDFMGIPVASRRW
ncbi:MAG: hypothetical protein U0452_09965 [Anaerolineae bacterium]